ncbi:starch-binding domain-containing protein 1 [Ranitomeya imitator]|uniref:starch-binding domain-containing protein 1 n=1 Tax=Ranitomeya imitator TaxID=111125 RepID=UPI0037E90493
MWPVLAIGIFTAIVAWIWYLGSGERKEPEAPVQETAVPAGSGPEDGRPACGEQESARSKSSTTAEPNLSGADPCEHGAPCPKIQAQNETKEEDPSDVDPLDLKVQSSVKAESNLSPSVLAEVGAGERLAEVGAGERLAEVGAGERLAEVGAGERLAEVGAGERLAEVGAGERLAEVGAGERLAEVGAGERLAEVGAGERLAEVGAGERLAEVGAGERLAEVGAGERLAEVGAGERLAEVARSVQHEGDTQEHKAPALPADIEQRPTDLEPDFQEHLPDATEGEELQADLLGAPTAAQSCPGVGTHSTGILAAGSTLSDGDQGVGEAVICPPVMAPAAERGLGDSGSTCRSDLGKAPGHQGDGEERVNGEAETGPGGQLENSSFVKENAIDVLESEESLKQEPYHEISMSSDIDQFIKDESLEKCDIKRTSECNDILKPSARSQEDVDVFDDNLNTSTSEALCDFQKLGTYPEGSSMEMHSLFNQEKAMSGLGSSNTNEKNSVYGSSEANINEADNQKTKKVATIQPMPQNVNFGLKVHYITHSDSQIIAVTGDHEKLGKWETYVPLTSGKDGFWSHSMTLPADTNVAWKFIMVEHGKIRRWEECNNRLLKITHEDIEGQLFWGYPIM